MDEWEFVEALADLGREHRGSHVDSYAIGRMACLLTAGQRAEVIERAREWVERQVGEVPTVTTLCAALPMGEADPLAWHCAKAPGHGGGHDFKPNE